MFGFRNNWPVLMCGYICKVVLRRFIAVSFPTDGRTGAFKFDWTDAVQRSAVAVAIDGVRCELCTSGCEVQFLDYLYGEPSQLLYPVRRRSPNMNLVAIQRGQRPICLRPLQHPFRPGADQSRHGKGRGFIHHVGEDPNRFRH